MSGREIRYFIVMISLTWFSATSLYGQACISQMYDCGNITALGGVCDSTQPTVFCITDTVGVRNISVSSADSTFICWGDGAISSFAGNYQQCVTHRFLFPEDSCPPNNLGRITINVEIGIANYCSGGLSYHYVLTPITIKFKPRASFNISTSDTCYSGPVLFTNTSCPNSTAPSYLWNFGDGTSDTARQPPAHQYAVPGTYTISLTVRNGCGTSVYSQTIRVRPPTVVNPVISLPNNCAPITFSPDVNSWNVLTYSWTNNNSTSNIIAPTDSQPTFTINGPGPYHIRLSVTGCCQSILSDCLWDTTLNLITGPTTAVSPIPDFCNSASFNPTTYFSASGSSITGYAWSFPGGSPASATTANPGTISYNSTGTYPVTLTLSTTCGPRVLTDTFQIGAPAILNLSPNTLRGCDSLNVSFVNTSPAGQSYSWSAVGGAFVSGTNATSQAPVIHYGSPGTYTVNVQATSGACAPQATSFQVQVGAAPVLSSVLSVPDICDTVVFDFSNYFSWMPASSDSGYRWMIYQNGAPLYSNSSAAPSTVNLTANGTYVVLASIWNNCDTVVLTDTFNYYTPAPLQLPIDTAVCFGSAIISLVAQPAGGSWSLNGVPVSGVFNSASAVRPANHLVYTYGASTCTQRDSFLVTVFGAGMSAGSDTGLCSNSGTVQLYGSPSGGYWTGNGIVDSIAGTYAANSSSGIQDILYYNLPDAALGCLIRDSIIVNIYAPTAGAFSIPDTGCIGQSLSLANTTPGTTATWNFGDGSALLTSNSANHTYPNPGNYAISVFVTNQYGCNDTFQTLLEVAQPPDAIFSLGLDNGCAPLSVPIQNLSVYYGGTDYSWNYGNGAVDTLFQPGTVTFSQGLGDSTIYVITLTSTNSCGSAVDQDTLTVYPVPVVDFGVSTVDSCSPSTVEFYNITIGSPQSFAWYIDGVFQTSDSALSPTVFTTDSTDRTYLITLASFNGCGSDTISHVVTVHPNTVHAFFNTDLSYGCRPLAVEFTSFVLPNAVIQWNFGDGSVATGSSIIHVFDTAGIFTVVQYVDNYCGFDTMYRTIEVLPQPELSFATPPVNCGNDTVNFLNTSSGLQGAIWDFGDGSPADSVSFSPAHLFPGAGQYAVSLIGIAAGTGCVDTITQLVDLSGFPSASFQISDVDGCAPLLIQFVSQAVGGNYDSWSLGTGDTLNGSTVSYLYQQPGAYTVVHSITDSNGCNSDSTYNFINVYPVPIADFSFLQSPSCQLPAVIDFTNTSNGASSFSWDFGSYGSTNTQDPSLSFTSPGAFNAELIAQNLYGCTDTFGLPAEAYASAIAAFVVSDTVLCPGEPVTFTSLSQQVNSFYWDLGNGVTQTSPFFTYSYSVDGVYDISLVVNNDSVCFDSLSIQDRITVYPKPTGAFTYEEITDTLADPSGIFQFVDQSIGAVRWLWQFSDGSMDTIANPIHRFFVNGEIEAMLVAFNQLGCSDTTLVRFYYDGLGSLFVPNAFTPDAGSDQTAFFIPKGVGLKEYLIEVYSPYGELVWYSNKLVNGCPSEKWDGMHLGKPVPQGAYAWKVRAIFQDGTVWRGMKYKDSDRPSTQGSVMVIR